MRSTRTPLGPDEEAALLAAVEGAVAEADAVILSDYGKGVLAPKVLMPRSPAPAAAVCRSMSIRKATISPAIAAPTCITPNQRELALAAQLPTSSDAEIVAAATAGAARQRHRVPCSRPARKKAWR